MVAASRIVILWTMLAAYSCLGWSAVPRIFYSDLESGPGAGGENNAGAFVTIHGAGFGSTRGTSTVTLGQAPVGAYRTWTDTKITFQVGGAAKTGDIVVRTDVGTSNGVPFTVRAGKIYFVAVNGSDSNSGAFASPWKTFLKARDTMQPGDITYGRDGVQMTGDDGQGWKTSMLLRTGGTAGKPVAIVAYPEAKVTIGTINGPSSAIRSMEQSPGYWVLAGLTLRGQNEAVALYGGRNWRFVANDMSCPNGNHASACFETGVTSYVSLLGNTVHDTGELKASALYHGVYFSTDTNHVEVGWNHIYNVRGCRGIQIHSSPLQGGGPKDPTGNNQYDISIHDNLIHDTQCDGIILATVDPSKGKIEIFNNVIYNAGKGPANPENSGNWSCIYVGGSTNTGAPGGGVVEVYNNTLVNCGSFATPPYRDVNNAIQNGGANPNLSIRIRNNLIVQQRGIPYLGIYGARGVCGLFENCKGITGSNNLFYGNGSAPNSSYISKSINQDPLFVNAANHDYRLSAASPARKAGIQTPALFDKGGQPRGETGAFDIGAYQYSTARVASVRCSPVVVSPAKTTCEILLAQNAIDTETVMSVSAAGLLEEPLTVKVPVGARTTTFDLEARAVPERILVSVHVESGGTKATAGLWVLPANDVAPLVLSAVNAASYSPAAVAPGGLMTLFGRNLGLAASGYGTFQVDVYVNGVWAPVTHANAAQLTVLVPEAIESSIAMVQVKTGDLVSNALEVPVERVAPGLFTADASGKGQALAYNQDGELNSPAHPAMRGATASFFATGLTALTTPVGHADGAAPPLTVTFSESSVPADAAAIEATSIAGVYRINVRVPEVIASGSTVPVTVAAAGNSSQPGVTLVIQ